VERAADALGPRHSRLLAGKEAAGWLQHLRTKSQPSDAPAESRSDEPVGLGAAAGYAHGRCSVQRRRPDAAPV